MVQDISSIPYFNVQWDYEIDLRAAMSAGTSGSFWLSLYNYKGRKALHTKVNVFSDRLEVDDARGLKAVGRDERSFTLTDDNMSTLIQAPLVTGKLGAPINSVHISPSGSLVIAGCDNGIAAVLDGQTLEHRLKLRGLKGDVSIARFFPSGKVAMTGGQDMMLRIWNLENLTMEYDGAAVSSSSQNLVGHHGTILDSAMIDRGRNVLSTSKDGTLRLWETGSATCVWSISPLEKISVGHINTVNVGSFQNDDSLANRQHELEFGTDGKVAVVGCDGGIVKGYDLRSKTEAFYYKASTSSANVTASSFLSTKSLVGVGLESGVIEIFDIRTQRTVHCTQRNESRINRLSLLENTRGTGLVDLMFANDEGSCPLISVNDQPNVLSELAGTDVEPINSFDMLVGDEISTVAKTNSLMPDFLVLSKENLDLCNRFEASAHTQDAKLAFVLDYVYQQSANKHHYKEKSPSEVMEGAQPAERDAMKENRQSSPVYSMISHNLKRPNAKDELARFVVDDFPSKATGSSSIKHTPKEKGPEAPVKKKKIAAMLENYGFSVNEYAIYSIARK
ncbi:Proteasomal ATPase-associated factor 1 [Phlyctochytrium planicorne]|nr:Proteasomal ATPase-associated factor 1 [Phlyctochytrium planicorne]